LWLEATAYSINVRSASVLAGLLRRHRRIDRRVGLVDAATALCVQGPITQEDTMAVNKPVGDNARKGQYASARSARARSWGKLLGRSAARTAGASWT
jgi:hypothetical protein